MFDLVNKPKLILPQISTVQHTSRETLWASMGRPDCLARAPDTLPQEKVCQHETKQGCLVVWGGDSFNRKKVVNVNLLGENHCDAAWAIVSDDIMMKYNLALADLRD